MRPPEVFRNDIRKCIYEIERKKYVKNLIKNILSA